MRFKYRDVDLERAKTWGEAPADLGWSGRRTGRLGLVTVSDLRSISASLPARVQASREESAEAPVPHVLALSKSAA